MEPADIPHDVQCVLPVCEYMGSLQTLTQFVLMMQFACVYSGKALRRLALLWLSISVAVREVVLLSDSSAYESITVWGRDCDSEPQTCDSEPQTCDSEPQTVICMTTVTVRERERELVWQWATDSNMYDNSHSVNERELIWQWATDSNMYDSSHCVRES